MKEQRIESLCKSASLEVYEALVACDLECHKAWLEYRSATFVTEPRELQPVLLFEDDRVPHQAAPEGLVVLLQEEGKGWPCLERSGRPAQPRLPWPDRLVRAGGQEIPILVPAQWALDA